MEKNNPKQYLLPAYPRGSMMFAICLTMPAAPALAQAQRTPYEPADDQANEPAFPVIVVTKQKRQHRCLMCR
jgi:hypothetical protein